ncbi:MAG: EAL domain-containing protein [Acidimicrobiales bacterium]
MGEHVRVGPSSAAGGRPVAPGRRPFAPLVGWLRRWRTFDEPALAADLLDQSQRLNLRATLGSPTTIGLILVALWSHAPHPGLIVWAATTTTMAGVHLAVHLGYLHRPAGSSPHVWRQRFTWAMVAGGAAWGALPLLALPHASSPEYQSVVALFVVSFMASNAIFTSPLRGMFLSFQVPLVVTATTGLAMGGTAFSTLLAVIVGYAFPFSLVLYDQANVNAVSAVRLARNNAGLVDELRAERERIEETNVELRHVNEQLTHQAAHDTLTDLANRTQFHRILEQSLHDARDDGRLVGVAFIDLDRFKLVNDSLGHHVGDDLLVAVAERLRTLLCDIDVLGRQGGDEFTLLLPDLEDADDGLRFVDSLRVAIREPFTIGNRELQREMAVTCSIGLAVASHPDDTAEDLMRHADAAMYRAKALGRDCVALFDESMRGELARRVDDEAELRRAFANREIVSWLQPEVDLFTGEIVGAESLARWVHPGRGVLSAGAFVPLAEECGMLLDLSRVTVASGAAARAALIGVVDPSFRIRLNVSAQQLMDIGLLNAFLEHLDRLELPPSTVAVEVTETAVIHDLHAARMWLDTARQLGVTVSLDDFGTGYSSLALLSQLPLDGVKIDLSFVRDMVHSPVARAVIAATVELASGLGLDVVAEGVESHEQAEALRRAGVRRAQGFLFAPAVPLETLRTWLIGGAPWQATFRAPDDVSELTSSNAG